MREIYFDNSATTRVYPEVVELMKKTMEEDYGNPSSKHIKGFDAEKYFRTAREQVANTLKVKPKEIIFTSGGTESNNTAIFGTALAKRKQGMHIISSQVEHAAIYKPLDTLAELGYEITYLPVDSKGHINLNDLRTAIRHDTILVTIMHVNNEIGAIEPVEEIGKIVKVCNPNTWFHTDAIQSYGKLTIRPKKQNIDMLSVSGHKIHGPKGVGFLYVDEKIRLRPMIYGGGQQEDMRSGTHNVPGIAGMGLAAELTYKDHDAKIARIMDIKNYFIDEVSKIDGVTVNSERGDASAPNIVSVSFEKVRAEVLLHALEEKGIYVSSGSACSSNHPGISGTLKAIGVKPELQDSTIRFSFGVFNEKEEVDLCMEALKELVPVLRRFTRF
ncbi:cysteine desulfurase family protein [Oribacterium sp. FC2011]|uniref:cysteine desulfurase family protein n=1 Tax=Oribacterium sp. FC2011 TaxID=1408311 RepID=UPI0004E1386D|nr:cysteine desulfurase family protein [Oribacterium sp. FC2011]